jgi:hypothetical protein
MPDPTTLIHNLCRAIATAEGYFVLNSLPARNNNPGDLRAAPWLEGATIHGGFWVATSPTQGIAGLYHQVCLNIARGFSLRKLVYTWAPPSDGNNSANYLSETGRRCGIAPDQYDTPLENFLHLDILP